MFKPFLLMIFCLIMASSTAQTHNVKCMRCKFSKYNLEKNRAPVKGRALDECACSACGEKSRKEFAARQAEEKKRVEAVIAKTKAIAEAKKKADQEKQQRQLEEAERKKAREEQDRVTREALIEKYRNLADKGKITANKTDATRDAIDLKITPFVNTRKKTYGFKADTLVVIEKPYAANHCSLAHIDQSNYFALQFYDEDYEKAGSHLLNNFGEEMTVAGVKKFSLLTWPNHQIHVYIDQAQPEFVRNWADVDYRGHMYRDRASAITEITRPRSGYSFGCEDNFVVQSKQIVLSLSLDVEQTLDGYRIFGHSAKCEN